MDAPQAIDDGLERKSCRGTSHTCTTKPILTFDRKRTFFCTGQPTNGACESAQVIFSNFDNTPITASTVGGSGAGFSCGTGNDSPAVFYQFVGNGARVRFSTCSEITDFNSELLLEASGKTCGSNPFHCNTPTGTLDTDCDPLGKAVYLEFFTVPDQLYLLAVQSRDSAPSAGNFGLSFLEYLRPENDVCASAALIPIDSSTSGSTANATRGAFSCGTGNESPAVFYQFLGIGGPVRLSTCSNVTNFNTEILVEGGGATCGGNPFYCSTPTGTLDSECDPTGQAVFIEIETVVNQVYLVAVQSRDTEGAGDFVLSLQSPGGLAVPMTNAPTGFRGSPAPTTGIATTGFPTATPLTTDPPNLSQAPVTAPPLPSPVTVTTGFPTETPFTGAPTESPVVNVAAATAVPTKEPSTEAPSSATSTNIDSSGALAKMSLPVVAVFAYFISCVATI